MADSQAAINNIVNSIINQYAGQMIDYYGTFPGEFVVPIAHYVDEVIQTRLGSELVPFISSWGKIIPDQLLPFFVNEEYEVGKIYPKGTVLVWDQPHLAIVVSSDGGDSVEVFEQAADPDGSVCGVKTRILDNQERICTYALIPVLDTPIQETIPPSYVYLPPTGALKIPIKTEKYYICKTLLGFSAYSKAINHIAATGTVAQGNWYIFRRTNGMLNVTKTPGLAGYWINPTDNKPD